MSRSVRAVGPSGTTRRLLFFSLFLSFLWFFLFSLFSLFFIYPYPPHFSPRFAPILHYSPLSLIILDYPLSYSIPLHHSSPPFFTSSFHIHLLIYPLLSLIPLHFTTPVISTLDDCRRLSLSLLLTYPFTLNTTRPVMARGGVLGRQGKRRGGPSYPSHDTSSRD